MINPVLSNFQTLFSDDFFPEIVTKKYDDFLFHKNYPFKTLMAYFYETIQNTALPGINLNTLLVAGINNNGFTGSDFSQGNHPTVNRQYPGTTPMNEIVDGVTVVITFRNTLINWMYCYEILYKYYARKRLLKDFNISLIMRDSAEIPMIKFSLSDCFISAMPGLSFAYNENFNISKTFDITFTFSRFDVGFIIPEFDLKKITLVK